MDKITIRMVNESDYESSINVIKHSFATVAEEFNLTIVNAPTNPAFITIEKVYEMNNKQIEMYGLYCEQLQIGFVAIEKANDDKYFIEKLSVSPKYRHNGYGKQLLDYAFHRVREKNGKIIEIGIINENVKLKNWYSNYGFIETGIKKYDYLPFTVCYMQKEINQARLTSLKT